MMMMIPIQSSRLLRAATIAVVVLLQMLQRNHVVTAFNNHHRSVPALKVSGIGRSTSRRNYHHCSSAKAVAISLVALQASIAPIYGVSGGIHSNNRNRFGGIGNNKKDDESNASLSSDATAANNKEMNPPPLKRHAPRKVCLMVEPTPFTHVSGYANRFKEMLKFMAKAGDDVHILTVDSKTPSAQLPTQYMNYPISHTQGFTFPLYNHISLTIDLPEMKGVQLIEKHKPDIIHVTSPGFLLFAAMFYARVMKIPLVMSYHTHLPSYGKNYLGFIPRVEKTCWDLLRYAHSRADLTLVTSPQMQQELQANGIPRVEVWRKGIDTERFHPSFKSIEMRHRMSDGNPNDFLLVYIGRLGAEKRLKDIRAVLQKMPSNTRLCIVGAGPQKEELEEFYKNEKVVFTGQLSGDDLSAAFASADVFVMPSDSETLGFVVLESMASGVPVIGAAAGGILDLIDDGKTSFLVEPGNTDQYVQRLTELRDVKFRNKMGKAARNEAEKWGWEAATSQLRNVQYEKALINFHSRAFGGFGRPGTAGIWRLFEWRVRSTIRMVQSYFNGPLMNSLWKRWSAVQKYLYLPALFFWNKASRAA